MKKGLMAMVLAVSILTSGMASAAPIPRTAKNTLGGGNNTIQGKITDESTRKSISEAVVYSIQSRVQGVSNSKGVYQLIVPKTDFFQTLKIMKKGYQTRYASFPVYGNTTYNIILTPKATETDTLTITAGTTIVATTIPNNATGVDYLNLNLTAGTKDDVIVSDMTFYRTGIGAASNFSNVYLYNGEDRLTSGESINSSNNSVTFSNMKLNVPAGKTVMVTLKGDMAGSSANGSENAIQIATAADIISSAAKVTMNGTISGPTMRIGSVSGATVSIAKSGTIPNPTVGAVQAKIAEFELSVTTENVTLQRLALIAKGTISAANDLSNFKLYHDSTLLAEDFIIDSQYLMTFVLGTPYKIERGDSRTFSVYADISSKADAGDEIRVYLDAVADLYAIGEVYGYGAAVTKTAYDGDTDTKDYSSSTLTGEKLTIAFNGPTATTIPVNAKDVVFLKLAFTSQANVEVKQLVLNVAATGTADGLVNGTATANATANFTDIKIADADTGAVLGSSQDLATSGTTYDSSQNLTYTDTWKIDAGQTRNIVVKMDIANVSALNGEQVKVTLNTIGPTGVKNLDSGDFLTADEIVPYADITGNWMTIASPSLNVSLASTPVSNTYVKGTKNVDVVGFVLSAGITDEITVTSLTVAGYIDEDADGDYAAGSESSVSLQNTVNSVTMYDDAGNKLADSKNVGTDGTAVFSNMTFKIPAGGSKKVVLKADQIATTAPQGSTNDAFGFDLTAVMAVKSDGGSVTVTPGFPNGGGTVISPTNDPRVAMTVVSAGSLSITNADNTVSDKTVVAGTDGVLSAKFKTTATHEDFKINELNFEVTNLTRSATNAVEYVYIVYKDATGASKTSSKVALTDGTGSVKLANFSNLDMYVPKDDTTITFEVYIDTNTVTSGATNSGDRIRVSFDATDATDEFEAIGQGSGTTITDSVTSSDADINNANGIALYKSIPTFMANTTKTGCPTNATKPANGTNNIYCFDVTTNSSGPIDIAKLTLPISISGATVNNTYLYDYSDQSTSLATATVKNNMATFTLNTPDAIEAGQTVTYMVKGNLTINSSAWIVTYVQADTNFVPNSTAASVNGNVVWSDRSAANHSTSTTDWTNGYKLSGLPTEPVSMMSL